MEDIDPRYMVMRSPRETLARRMSMAARLSSAMLLALGLFWGTYFLIKGPIALVALDAVLVVSALACLWLHQRGRAVLAVKLVVLTMLVYLVPMAVFVDSHTASLPRSVHNGLLPVGVAAFLLFRDEERWFGGAVMAACVVLAVALGSSNFGVETVITVPDDIHRLGAWINNALAFGFLFTQLHFFIKDVNGLEAQLLGSNNRFVRMLGQAFPRPIAERMLTQHGSFAVRHASVSILFADLVGFTAVAERMPPADVVAMLDRVFSEFDAALERAGLTKIKTIGDAYMAAAGVPEDDPRHARKAIDLALRMQAIIQAHPPLQLRIGVASGEVVAGVIGESRQSYDVWGDTVNTAARIESASQPGRILVDARTRDACGDAFAFEPPISLQLKGKALPTEAAFVAVRRAT